MIAIRFQVARALMGALVSAQAREAKHQTKHARRAASRDYDRKLIVARQGARAGARDEAGALRQWAATHASTPPSRAEWLRSGGECEAWTLTYEAATVATREREARLASYEARARARREVARKIEARARARARAREAATREREAALVTLKDWLGAQHKAPRVRRAPRRGLAPVERVGYSVAAMLAAPFDVRTLALALPLEFFPPGRETGAGYVAWWREAAPVATVAALVGECGEHAARRASGKFGKVSSTSIDEAGAVGRAAALAFFARRIGGRHFVVTSPEDSELAIVCPDIVSPRLARAARRAAVAAGVRSLLGDLTGGQRGKTDGLRLVRRAAVETIDNLVRGGLESGAGGVREAWAAMDAREPDYHFRLASRFDSLPGGERELMRSGRARSLDLVLAVRRVRTDRLGEQPRGKGWQARLALVVRRYTRIARALSSICQGQSLELACRASGFGYEARDGRSRAFDTALDQSGVRAALCVATGAGAGARGSVGRDLAPSTV